MCVLYTLAFYLFEGGGVAGNINAPPPQQFDSRILWTEGLGRDALRNFAVPFWGRVTWHFPSSDLHENYCAGSQYIDQHTILGLNTLIKQLMTSNDH